MSETPASARISEVDPRALASFTRQLGAMLQAGVDVLRALRIASSHSGDARILAASGEISSLLEDGRELHVALARHPQIFGPFYVEMARQGEQDGTLGQVLLSVAEYLERLADLETPAAAPAEVTVSAEVSAPVAPASFAPAAGAALLGAGVAVLVHALGAISAAAAAALALLWAGAVLLYASSRQRTAAPPASPRAAAPPPPRPVPPPKSRERVQAETEGIVRAAVIEQDEEQEQQPEDPARAFDSDPFGDAESLLSDELTRKRS
ncbi:MAG: type II secretion system F family protein [Armatimonadota bacterium]